MAQTGAYLRPGFFLRRVVNPVMMRFGFETTLAVRGRTSGEWRTTPVTAVDHEGARYVVSPRGLTQWVRNLRAAGECELRRRGDVQRFRAVEVDGPEREAVIAIYREKVGKPAESQFKELPDPADHPTFRLEAPT
jgi:deazaflavin-dependent oxidoreductase (nitroreductase family)